MRSHAAQGCGARPLGVTPAVLAALAALALVAGSPLAGSPLAAQEVYGVLRVRTPPAPASGVVITATRLADGSVVGRAVTGPSGSFRMVVGPDSVSVRALRIGERPVTLFKGRLPPGERHDLSQELPDEPVVIATVRVREPARCGVPTDDGSVVSALFADALTALAASVSTMEGTAPVVRTLSLEEDRDRRDALRSVSPPMVREGATMQPYRSVPVPTLLREGFVTTDARGDQVYRAPDAIVLSDDRFLAGTCLTLDRSRENDGQVGIAFAPARRSRGRVDVRGVLWLDAESRTLERLEFGYVGLSGAAASVNPGGTVEYAQLPDGRWLIDRWALRMPTLVLEQARVTARATSRALRAAGSRVVHGVVSEVRQGDRLLYTVGGRSGEAALLGTLLGGEGLSAAAALTERAPSSPATLAAASALGEASHCEPTASTATLALGVLVLGPGGTPISGATVEAAWRDRYAPRDASSWGWERAVVAGTTSAGGGVVLCGVTRQRAVEVRVTVPDCPPVQVAFRPSERAVRSDVEVRLPRRCGR